MPPMGFLILANLLLTSMTEDPRSEKQTQSPETERPETVPSGSVRLRDGGSRCAGRVELRQGRDWRPLCREFWARQAAQVLCRELGCGAVASDRPRPHPGPHWVGALNCSGAESGWERCPYTQLPPGSQCDRNLSLVLTCTEHRELRLAAGGSPCAGRVELRWRGRWGTVCDDGWDLREAAVVCRQLGCGRPLAAPPAAAYGPGRGPVYLDQLGCRGDEAYLWACPGQPWQIHDCGHKEDASVECSGHRKMRLSGGGNRCEGPVSVREDGEWGALCAETWDQELATGVCGHLGCGTASELGSGAMPREAALWTSQCGGNTSSLPACLRRRTDPGCARQAVVVCSASFNMTGNPTNFTSAPNYTGAADVQPRTPTRERILLLTAGILLFLLLAQSVIFIASVLRLRHRRVMLLAQPSRTESVISNNDYREVSGLAPPIDIPPPANHGPRPAPSARTPAGHPSSSDGEYEGYHAFAPKVPRDFSTFRGTSTDQLRTPGSAALNPLTTPRGHRAPGVKGRGSSKRRKRSEGSSSGEGRTAPKTLSSRSRRSQIPRQASADSSSTSSCEWYENTRHDSEEEEVSRRRELQPELLAPPVEVGPQSSTCTLPLEEYENLESRPVPRNSVLVVAHSGTGQGQEDSTESDYDDIATYATS